MAPVRWLAVTSRDVPAGDAWLGPDELAKQATLRFAKRRDDWRLKRWAAKQALGRLTHTSAPERLQVLNTEDGRPVAYDGRDPLAVTLSLTDRDGTAVCMVGPPAARLGCDLELVEPRSPTFVADWLTPPEQAAVAAAGQPDLVANLIWSAKEAALKALAVGLRRPTRAVEVTPGPPPMSMEEWSPLEVRAEEGLLRGWWRPYRAFVLTAVADGAAPPEALAE
jgi:4'-phosphopantetheinyl transferase